MQARKCKQFRKSHFTDLINYIGSVVQHDDIAILTVECGEKNIRTIEYEDKVSHEVKLIIMRASY